jgi:O-antigen/teichoic acid export membrane protein
METAYFRFATKKDGNGLIAYNNAFTSIFITTLFLSGTIYLFSDQLSSVLGYDNQGNIIRWIAWILAIDALAAIPFARLRLLNRVYLFAGAKISSVLLNIFLTVFFLKICPLIINEGWFSSLPPLVQSFYSPTQNVSYVFLANLLSNIAFIPFLIPAFIGMRFKINFSFLKEMLHYGFPILLMGIAGTVNEMFSRTMLKKLLPEGFYPGQTSEQALGIFGACYKLAVFMVLAIQAFRFASEPFFFSNAKDKNAPDLFAKVMSYFVIVCVGIFLFVSINVNWFADLLIARNEYKEGLYIVPVLLLGNLFMGIYFNLSVWYKLTDKTYFGTYITLFGAAITIVGNVVLIPILGYYGSVWATFGCYFCMVVASYSLGRKYFYVPYKVVSMSLYLIVGIAILFACQTFIGFEQIANVLTCNTIILFYVFILLILERKKVVL